MKPSVTVAWGGGLHLHGSPLGTRSVAMDTTNSPILGGGTSPNVFNAWNRGGVGFFNDFHKALYGGELSIAPNGFSNHKPAAFYYGDLYLQKNVIAQQQKIVWLLRFDGSGQNLQTNNGSIFSNKSHSGRGMKWVGPSGLHNIHCHPLAHVVHNGALFMVGAFTFHDENPANTKWRTEDWNIVDHNINTSLNDAGEFMPRRRAYGAFTVHKKTKDGKDFRDAATNLRRFNNSTTLSGIAPDKECLGACDGISWENSVIYANHCDIVEFPGGSGTARFIERNDVESTSKCFEQYPTSGFNSSNSPVGKEDLMVMTGSGVLKRILFPGDPLHNVSGHPEFGLDLEPNASGRPFGLESMVNLGSLVADFNGPKVRTDGQLARVTTVSSNPTRSCLLKNFNNRLHAFFISASSGYYHFVCDGNPRTITNWVDRTAFLPEEFKLFDGDLFGYVDDFHGTLACQHIAKSNIGLYGVTGGNRGAGGWSIYELRKADSLWQKVSNGGSLSPGVGFIPYDPDGVYSQVSSGVFANNPEVIASTDYALVNYKLFVNRKPAAEVDVDIEYTVNNGVTWQTASRFEDYNTGTKLGDPKTNRASSVSGSPHEFYWAHVKDVGFNQDTNARLRITPKNPRAL